MKRRLFLACGLGIASVATMHASNVRKSYRFRARNCDIEMSLEFFDRHTNKGFQFEHVAEGPFCLSVLGTKNENCVAHFTGSMAIARYRIQPVSPQHRVSMLREHVRTIDRDERLVLRPPFERTLLLQGGMASDIQAFGYEKDSDSVVESPDAPPPWYYFRQDLYLETDTAPFLIVHWRHAIGAIRMLDIIPGQGTLLAGK